MTTNCVSRARAVFAAMATLVALGSIATAEAKTGRTYYDAADIARARELVKTQPWAQAVKDDAVRRAAWLLEISDEDLWDYVPPASQLRALEVAFNHGCPV